MLAALAFVYGLVVGSFLNVCIYRIPAEESVVTPPSRCPSCGKRLGPAEMLPVISFLLQRGRCRGCGVRISPRYAVVELLTGLVFMTLALRFGWPAVIWQAVFYAIMIAIFFIDLDHQIIPNRLVLALLVLALLKMPFVRAVTPLQAVLGALVGGGLFLLLAIISGGGMGGGDVKLMAVLGLWFGWQPLILVMFFAFVGGGLVGGMLLLLGIKKRKDPIPFGPFLVLAAFIVSMWGERFIYWYLRVSGLL